MEKVKKVWLSTKSKILKIWKDPVLSKVIGSIILIIVTTIWASIKQYSIIDIYQMALRFINFEIPVYLVLSTLGIILLIKFIIWLFRSKGNKIWNDQIGDFTFKELYNILQSQRLPVRTKGMEWSGREAPQEDLLLLFYINNIFLNMGVTLDRPASDGGYLFGVLCPKLVSYGIVERIDYKDEKTKKEFIKYQTSELGHKFYRNLEKINFLKKINNGTDKN